MPTEKLVIERLRRLCLSFPDAVEKISHGEPTWRAGKGKLFAMLDNHHHGAPHLSVWVPQAAGMQSELVGHDPKRFFIPPYVGPSGWVGVVLDTRPNWSVVEKTLREGYVLVAGTRLRARLLERGVS